MIGANATIRREASEAAYDVKMGACERTFGRVITTKGETP